MFEHRLAKENLRDYVRRRDRCDFKTRRWIGMDTFVDDWQQLASINASEPTVNRTLWLLWLQGETSAPALVRQCISSWRAFNSGWNIKVLSLDNLSEFIDLPRFPRHVSDNHKANIIRLRLLERHGGVWADSTTACQIPLDDWIDAAAGQGFFAFTRPQPLRAVANWFIAARPNNPLLRAWRRWSEAYILSRRRPRSYFWQHHTFDWLLMRYPELYDVWANIPKVSARGPHVMQRLIDGHLSEHEVPTPEALRRVPLLKLNRRKGYELTQIRKFFTRFNIDSPI